MSTPTTIKLDPLTGDLDLSRGFRLTNSAKEYTPQKLTARMQFFLGEWFADQRLGVPYFELVFIENPDIPLLTSLYRKAILEAPTVRTIEQLTLRFDKRSRTLFVAYTVRLVDGSTIVAADTPFVLTSRQAG